MNHTVQQKTAKMQILGMLAATTATSFYATNGTIAQYLRGSMVQLLFLRFAVQAICSCIWWIIYKPQKYADVPWYGERKNILNIWLRGFCYWWATLLLWRGLNYVAIGNGMIIWHSSPLIVAIFGKIWLKEKLPKYFVITFILTTIGLIFVCQPEIIFSNISSEYSTMNYKGILLIFIGTSVNSLQRLLTRKAVDVYFIQIELTTSFQTIIWSPLIIIYCKYLANDDWISGDKLSFDITYNLIALLMGCIGFTACLLNIVAYQYGEATKIAWFEYCDLIFVFTYQVVIFNTIPNMWDYIGLLSLLIGAVIPLIEQVNLYRNAQNYTELISDESISAGDSDSRENQQLLPK